MSANFTKMSIWVSVWPRVDKRRKVGDNQYNLQCELCFAGATHWRRTFWRRVCSAGGTHSRPRTRRNTGSEDSEKCCWRTASVVSVNTARTMIRRVTLSSYNYRCEQCGVNILPSLSWSMQYPSYFYKSWPSYNTTCRSGVW